MPPVAALATRRGPSSRRQSRLRAGRSSPNETAERIDLEERPARLRRRLPQAGLAAARSQLGAQLLTGHEHVLRSSRVRTSHFEIATTTSKALDRSSKLSTELFSAASFAREHCDLLFGNLEQCSFGLCELGSPPRFSRLDGSVCSASPSRARFGSPASAARALCGLLDAARPSREAGRPSALELGTLRRADPRLGGGRRASRAAWRASCRSADLCELRSAMPRNAAFVAPLRAAPDAPATRSKSRSPSSVTTVASGDCSITRMPRRGHRGRARRRREVDRAA